MRLTIEDDESPEVSGKWRGNIDKTRCLQPGQGAAFTYVTVDLRTMAIERHVDRGLPLEAD